MDSIWDIMISNTDNMNEERLYEHLMSSVPYDANLTDEGKKNIFTDDGAENLCIMEERTAHAIMKFRELLNTKDLSAWAIMDVCCDLLLDFPQFELEDVSTISCGMLTRAGISKTLSEDGLVYNILGPNLYCVLLLEAKGQRLPDNDSRSLKDIADDCGFDVNYSNMSRSLSSNNFPDILKELFAVEQSGRRPYEIRTPYSRLFAAELNQINDSPLRTKEYSCIQHRTFYDMGIDAIGLNGDCALDSIADYYLFERFFRLNTEFQLLWGEYQFGTGKSALSPALLGDFFYSCPLALLPDGLLSSLFYKPNDGDSDHMYLCGAQFLHFLIQLSSYWFPIVLNVLREYMDIHNIKSPDDVKSFFSKSIKFQSSLVNVMPKCRFAPDDIRNNRRLKEDYAERWQHFSPIESRCREALTPLTLEEWSSKRFSEAYTALDCIALKDIQETL